MPLDPNLALQAQAPQIASPLDLGMKAMSLKQLAMQNTQAQQTYDDDQATRAAFRNNMTTGPDGTLSLNRPGVVSELMNKSNPKNAIDYQKLFQGQDLEKLKRDTDVAKQLAWSISDEPSYQAARQKALQMNLPNANQLPPTFSPSFVQNWQMHTLSGEDQLKNHMSQQELDIKKQDMALQRQKLYGGAETPPGAPGSAGAPQGAQGASPTDPAQLVPFNVPEHHQAKAFAEIDAAQNTSQNASKILKAFDDAANNWHGVDVVPGILNKDQKALHTLLGPTFKDVEGTVRQAAMDNIFQNTTPEFLDGKATTATKRAALVGYLQSKSSAPTNKGYNIDLKKFPSTFINDKTIGRTVQMRDPKGNIREIPADQVDAAKAAGGQPL